MTILYTFYLALSGISKPTSIFTSLANSTIFAKCTDKFAASSKSCRGIIRRPDFLINWRASFTFVPYNKMLINYITTIIFCL